MVPGALYITHTQTLVQSFIQTEQQTFRARLSVMQSCLGFITARVSKVSDRGLILTYLLLTFREEMELARV